MVPSRPRFFCCPVSGQRVVRGWLVGGSEPDALSRQLPAGFLRQHNCEIKPSKAPKHEQKPTSPSPIANAYQKRARP